MKIKGKITKKLVSIVVCMALILTCLPLTASAESVSVPKRYDLENVQLQDDGLFIDANGTHLYIDDGTIEGNTVIYYMNGSEKVYVSENGEAGEDLHKAFVCGGTHRKNLMGDTHITMYGGNISSLYGGGIEGSINGSVTVEMYGGTVNTLYGTFNAAVTGDSNITITGGVANFVSTAAHEVSCHIYGNAQLIITGGTVGNVVGATGSHPVEGTVSGVVCSGTIYSVTGLSQLVYFDNLIYKDGTKWVTKGNPVIPEGITVDIPAGDTFTIDTNTTISNKGTIVNNGTMTLNGKISGGKLINNGNLILNNAPGVDTLENHGTVTNNAVYVEDVNNITALDSVIKDNVTITPGAYIFNNRLYLFTGSGHIMAKVNGQEYYGVYGGSGELQLTKDFVKITDVENMPAKAFKNIPITLPTTAVPSNASVPCDVVWTSTSANATLSGNVLTPTASSGTIQVTATVKNGLGYGQDFTKTYTLSIQEGTVFSIANGAITVTGKDDGSATVQQETADGTIVTEVGKDEVLTITGTATSNDLTITGGKITIQFDDLNMRSDHRTKGYTRISETELNLILSGDNYARLSVISDTHLTIAGDGTLSDGDSSYGNAIAMQGDGSLTINGGHFLLETYMGSSIKASSLPITINGGTISMNQIAADYADDTIDADTLTINGGNMNANTLKVTKLNNADGNTLKYAEITLEGVTEDVAVTAISGIEYGLKNVETLKGKVYVYADDVEKIASITAGGKTYVGQLTKSGTKYYNDDDAITKYTGTFFEGSLINITGVTAEDGVYDGQQHQGYKGTIENSGGYTGDYTISYSGRNNTVYSSSDAPINAGEYTVTISVADKANKVAGVLSLDFVISPIELKGVTVELSEDHFVYDGTEHKPDVTVKDKDGTVITEALYPYDVTYKNNVNAGTGMVIVSSKANQNYAFEVAATIEIDKATYDMSGAKWAYTDAFSYDGKSHSVWVDESSLPEGVYPSNYTGNTASEVGKYTANVSLVYDYQNYNKPEFDYLLSWEIKNDWIPTQYMVTTPNTNGWLKDYFAITPAEGYQVSQANTADAIWSATLAYTEETADGSVTFYLKNVEDGTISLAATETYKIDKTPATGRVSFDENNKWESFLNAITFGLLFKNEVTVEAEAADALSGIADISYAASDKAMTLDEVKAISEWKTLPNDGVGVDLEDGKKFVYFVRIIDKAGNVTYLSTDGAEYDTTAPVIGGVENGKTYYLAQNFTVDDSHLDSVTVNGSPDTTYVLEGNVDKEYVIVATDAAGNTTTITVTMKPIASISEIIEDLAEDNVTSDDTTSIDEVKQILDNIDTTNATEEEKEALQAIGNKVAELEKVLDDAAKATDTENTEKVKDITADNVTPEDKDDLINAKEDYEKALVEYGDNYTEAEKTAIENEINRIEDALEVIEDVAAVEELINKIPETITKEDAAAIKAAEDAYDDLSDHGKSLVDKDLNKKLKDAKAALKKLTNPNDKESPNTGNNTYVWLVLLLAGGIGVCTTTFNSRKRVKR